MFVLLFLLFKNWKHNINNFLSYMMKFSNHYITDLRNFWIRYKSISDQKPWYFSPNVSSYIWHSGAFLRSMYKIGQYHDWLGSGYCVCGVCSVVHTRSSVQHQTTSASLSFELRGEFPDWCLSVSASKKKGTYTCLILINLVFWPQNHLNGVSETPSPDIWTMYWIKVHLRISKKVIKSRNSDFS